VNIISGRYTIYDLGRGSYRLVVEADHADATPRSVSVGLTPITVNFVTDDSGAGPGGSEHGWAPTLMTLVGGEEAPPDVSSGSRLVAQGTATTMRGTPAVGHIDVYQSDRLIGRSMLVSGRYTIYDLPRGDYRLTMRANDTVQARSVTIGHSAIVINFVAR